jgi:hypothetical protein
MSRKLNSIKHFHEIFAGKYITTTTTVEMFTKSIVIYIRAYHWMEEDGVIPILERFIMICIEFMCTCNIVGSFYVFNTK